MFLHDEIQLIPDELSLILGTKIEYNVFTGFEFQPSVRTAWNPIRITRFGRHSPGRFDYRTFRKRILRLIESSFLRRVSWYWKSDINSRSQ